MKVYLSLVVLALLAGWTWAQEPTEALATKCDGAPDISCSAYATLEIVVTGGTCEGEAGADCEAIGVSQSKYVEAYDEWFGGGKETLCDSGKASAAANAVATAVAEVWTNAQAKVTCSGKGFACGYSVTGGTAFAVAMAEALAQAAADVSVGEVADAFCFADVRAMSTAIAKAAADATATACVTDEGTEDDWQESYVSAITSAIADAFATATASACAEDPTTVTADSKCTGKATSEKEDDEVVYGDACGGVTKLPACEGQGAQTCCDPSFARSFCKCENCDGPWIKKSERGDLKKVFQNKSKKSCFCADTEDAEPVPDPTPAEPVPDPTPAEPVPDPTPAEPVPDPTPAEPVPDPTPAEPVPDPTPAEPVPDPTPAEPVPDPTPAEPVPDPTPAEPVPAPSDQSTSPPDESAPPSSGGTEGEPAPDARCKDAADTTCGAFATLEILATDGTCEGEAGASCEAYTESVSEFKDAFNEWWQDPDSYCDEGKAEAAAKATGLAMAAVWAEAATKVQCYKDGGEPQGFACGWSASGGTAWAQAFAEAVAQAAADASSTSGVAEAFCYADVRAVSSAVAQAAANAQSDACSDGKAVEDYQDAVAESVSVALAEAYAKATAKACDKGEEVVAESKCEGAATSDQESDEFTYGDACSGASQSQACSASFGKCCKKSYKRRPCDCRADKCEGDRWLKQMDWNDEKAERRSFKSRKSKATCFCLEG